ASQGGGNSQIAFDRDQYDPDAFRIGMQVRPWPSNAPSRLNFKLGIQLYDKGEPFGAIAWTNHLTRLPGDQRPDGWSAWAHDADSYDPDGAGVYLYVEPVYQAYGK
ncbi:hypothetical protein HZA73_00640, partial [candidate division TA06 bacterium]|nr:hypothetical protein [candidate division TA06 bacterium]